MPHWTPTRDRIEDTVRGLWACGLPDALSHGDLHLGNVAYDGQQLRVFDWTDGCVSHPFLDGSHLVYFSRDNPGDPALARAFAEPWRAAYPRADIDRALDACPRRRPGVPGDHASTASSPSPSPPPAGSSAASSPASSADSPPG